MEYICISNERQELVNPHLVFQEYITLQYVYVYLFMCVRACVRSQLS